MHIRTLLTLYGYATNWLTLRTGHGRETHFRRLSSIGDQMQSATLTIRTAQYDLLTAAETGVTVLSHVASRRLLRLSTTNWRHGTAQPLLIRAKRSCFGRLSDQVISSRALSTIRQRRSTTSGDRRRHVTPAWNWSLRSVTCHDKRNNNIRAWRDFQIGRRF